jgi:NodT family efflux transporter outer membrane factor (OMF) lipoprotein
MLAFSPVGARAGRHRLASARSARLLIPTLLAVALLGGCATAPRVPEADTAVDVPERFREAPPVGDAAAQAAPAEIPSAWWTLFRDPVLDQLQQRLVVGNENLKAAVAQVQAARAALGSARAAQWPLLSATGGAGRADNGASVRPQNSLFLSANAAWELDLWGRLAQGTRAGETRLRASEADLASARLSLQAGLTQSYLALRAAEAQQAVLQRSVAAYRRSLELTELRRQGGVALPSDVLQARTQLQTAQVQLVEAGSQRALAEHAIAVLLGQAPAALALVPAATADLPQAPAAPALLPGTLLQRRPDIRAAHQRLEAAWAQVGVADAGFFPAVTLSASGGLRSGGGASLFDASSLAWSVGGALAQRLFDGGAQQAAVDAARAGADAAAAAYRQTVLTALLEVEDNLVLAQRLQDEAALLREALGNAQRNLEITQEQYRVGTVGYLNVVTAQNTALTAERSLLDVQARQLNAVNQLLKNLAGRW